VCTETPLYEPLLSISETLGRVQSLIPIGVFIANADGSIVLATYGIISSDIGGLDDAIWLVVTYTLAMCAVQPTVSRRRQCTECPSLNISLISSAQYGKLSDIYGRKSILIVAYAFFGLGCALW
jgi:MFS family permease